MLVLTPSGNSILHSRKLENVSVRFQLYALMFNAAAGAFTNATLPSVWHLALKRGLEAVMRYGEARPGCRSMVKCFVQFAELQINTLAVGGTHLI